MEHINKYEKYNYKEININREAGILMPIFSLHNNEGIGTFGDEAYDFVDFLVTAKQSYWQILPLNPTTFGDSPYLSYSSFAGNPYFISLEMLAQEELLKKEDFEHINFGDPSGIIDYEKLYFYKLPLLKKAYETNQMKQCYDMSEFIEENKGWLEDYALFMSLKGEFDQRAWTRWPEEIKNRQPEVLHHYKEKLKEKINYYYFEQFLFFRQFKALKAYANKNGIRIIGDLPIYIAPDSADIWSHKSLFLLNEDDTLKYIGGCPPDAFSEDGQMWGNPVYDWEENKKTGYSWWLDRIRHHLKLFDRLRLDHFRGFESFWKIPAEETTSKNGEWMKGPGMDFFNKVLQEFPASLFIAEDLGYMTKEVHELRRKTGFPGMKVLLFAFDTSEESDYLPHNITRNCVAYTGTHDNDTVKGWIENVKQDELAYAINYLKLTQEEGYVWGMIRACWQSVADLAICQIQDVLELGNEARINHPSTLGNWRWRVDKEALGLELALRLGDLTTLYGRTSERREKYKGEIL